jgi:hypothetical protein
LYSTGKVVVLEIDVGEALDEEEALETPEETESRCG